MLTLIVVAQLAASRPAPPSATSDSTYATPALQAMVAAAAAANRLVPAELSAYRAHVEAEFALIARDSLSVEYNVNVQQVAAQAVWSRAVGYEFHVVGYRSTSPDLDFGPFDVLGHTAAVTLPMLYGDRISMGWTPQRDSETLAKALNGVHPFASDRDEYYRFTGGDTVAVIHESDGHSIPIARIRVRPTLTQDQDVWVYDGEVDIDATRDQIVRMRGRFIRYAPHARFGGTFPGVIDAEYIDFENQEVNERYWLPSTQRTEWQAEVALLAGLRGIQRITTRFSAYAVDDTTRVASPALHDGVTPGRVTFAPRDSVSAFDAWAAEPGVATGRVNANDFDDLAPPNWKPTGPPIGTLWPTRTDRAVHFNRIEGLYTGLDWSVRMRDFAPGVTAQVFGGWAWTEQTLRGGTSVAWQSNDWATAIRAERALVDFPSPFGGDGGELLGSLYEDYIDRSSVAIAETHGIGSLSQGLVTLQLGEGRDQGETARLKDGLFFSDGSPFRPNRNVLNGSYTIASVDVEYHPGVMGGFAQPGFGGFIYSEGAVGQLSWESSEISAVERQYFGRFVVSVGADAGAVFGSVIPPQQIFVLAGADSTPRYSYAEFAGDRFALFHASAYYRLPFDHRPHRVFGVPFPGANPEIGATVRGFWTELSSTAATTAVDELGAGWSPTPVSKPTDGIRGTAFVGVRFFGGLLSFGITRPLNEAGPWRWAGHGVGVY